MKPKKKSKTIEWMQSCCNAYLRLWQRQSLTLQKAFFIHLFKYAAVKSVDDWLCLCRASSSFSRGEWSYRTFKVFGNQPQQVTASNRLHFLKAVSWGSMFATWRTKTEIHKKKQHKLWIPEYIALNIWHCVVQERRCCTMLRTHYDVMEVQQH